MTFKLTLRLPNDHRQIELPDDDTSRLLADALVDEGLPLNTRCGHRSLCDGCQIDLLSGKLLQRDTGKVVTAGDAPLKLRGCEFLLPPDGFAEISVPARSLLAHQPQVVSSFQVNVPRAHDPLWQEIVLEQHDLSTERPLVDALCRAVIDQNSWADSVSPATGLATAEPDRNGQFHLACERRQDGWLLDTCSLHEPAFGAAVDIGTTTVAVTIVELSSGRIAGNASALNAQVSLGDNVLTRINACMVKPRMTQRMQQALVRKTLGPLLRDAVRDAGIHDSQLVAMVVAGNTTMLHLLAGVDPSSMGMAPFTPTFLDHRIVNSRQLKLRIGQRPTTTLDSDPGSEEPPAPQPLAAQGENATDFPIHMLPGAAAYVGADITAGVLASGMAYDDKTSLLVDLGTNGEIVLRHGATLLGCATAAGPAFEGAGLTSGVRAGSGAIGHIWFNESSGEPRIEVIGGGLPIGICGTAYVDFVARARQSGLISTTGRFSKSAEPHVERHEEYGLAFPVARGRDERPILITEADIASLLQAKAAIAAGVHCLLKRAGLNSQDVETVFLAGGFGFHMQIDSLLGCGLLPEFVPNQITLVGNTALAGAYLSLMDSGALDEMRRLCQRIKIIELNLEPEFETTYIDHLSLPE